MSAHIHHVAQKHVAGVERMQRIDLGVLRAVEIVDVVALDGLVQERQAQQDDQRDNRESGTIYHCTGTPGSSVQTEVPGRSRISSASCSGRPVSGGNVPKCSGITRRTSSIRQARAASRGLIV